MTDNVIVCPHCDKQFIFNKVNGIALLQLVQDISARQRMYCKLALDSLEREKNLSFPAAKKIYLDNFNDFARDVHTMLGFGVEAE